MLYQDYLFFVQIPYFPVAVQDWYQYDAASRAVLDPWSAEFQGTGESHLDSDFREYAPDSVQVGEANGPRDKE